MRGGIVAEDFVGDDCRTEIEELWMYEEEDYWIGRDGICWSEWIWREGGGRGESVQRSSDLSGKERECRGRIG